VIRRWVWNT